MIKQVKSICKSSKEKQWRQKVPKTQEAEAYVVDHVGVVQGHRESGMVGQNQEGRSVKLLQTTVYTVLYGFQIHLSIHQFDYAFKKIF